MSTQEIADTIRKQIGVGPLMSLGARKLRFGKIAPLAADDFLPSLIFDAKILPFKKDGTRGSAPRIMQVSVGYNNAKDLYDVRVVYFKTSGKGGAVTDKDVHYVANDVDAESLSRVLLSLDYDGETVTNPRYH